MTEHNIFQEIQEDLERQRLEELWKRYGGLVLAAVLIIVLGTAGITGWHSWRSQKNQKETGGLITLMKPAAGSDDTQKIAALQDFARKNKGGTQAVFAQLQAANLAAKDGKSDDAIAFYDSIAKNSSADPAFRQLADIFSIGLQLDKGDPAELQKRLQPLQDDKAPWRFTAMEYAGYLALRAGDKEQAKQIFTSLSQNSSAPPAIAARAADMLRYVAE